MKHRVTAALLLIATAAASCGDDNLPEVSQATNLRVLAIKSDPVTVRAGANSATFTALITDPKGGGRAITYTWNACVIAQVDSTGTRCSQSIATSTQTTTGTTPQFVFTNGFSGAAPVLITLDVTAGGESRAATKSLAVIEASAQQTAAPVLSTVSISGDGGSGTATLPAGQGYDVEASVSGVTGKPYFITWVTDGGTMDGDRTSESNRNRITPKNVSGSYNLYVILNDGAGGVDFKVRAITVP